MHKIPTIAYFSAEYSIADSLPIYAGGLGILAGDTVQEAGAERRDFVALGLVYHKAFTTGDDDKRTITERLIAEGFDIARGKDGQTLQPEIQLGNETINVQAWNKNFGSARLLLLDTKLPQNSAEAQKITDHLYDGAPGMMLKQQIVLGLGSIRILELLDINPDIYHLNEGHMSFVAVAVAAQHQANHPELTFTEALTAIKPRIVATKHTILPGAGLTLDAASLDDLLGTVLSAHNGSVNDLLALGAKDDGYFSTTRFMIKVACRHNGVSEIHVASELEKHPDSPLIAITNGIYSPRWRAGNLKDDEEDITSEHDYNRAVLIDYVKTETGQTLSPDTLTVVWARRMTEYKRPALLVNDLSRLAKLIQNSKHPIQFIIAGQANPVDQVGQKLMNQVIDASKQPVLSHALAYLPHYNPATARLLVQGADVWLNTPIRGQEACGTSGMKASLNGTTQFSTSDGWIDEVALESIGWRLADDNPEDSLFETLRTKIAPLYYDQPEAWTTLMHANIALIKRQFTTKRMLNDYYTKLYT